MTATCELIQIMGKPNLIRLQAALGPRNMYVPTEATIGHPICNAIGRVAMGQLCQEFGGTTIWIGNGYANTQRNAEILRMQMAGASAQTVARKFGISARHVRTIVQGEKPVYFGSSRRRLQSLIQGIAANDRVQSVRKTRRNESPNRKARRMAAAC